MGQVSKIVQHGLEDEVRQLARAGFSRENIASHINHTHNDVQVSHMAIQRFLESNEVQEIRKELDAGTDLESQLRAELREGIDEQLKETEEIFKIMKKALKRIVKEGDDIKTIKAAKDTLSAIDQTVKALNTKVESGYKRFANIQKAEKINYVQINNLLIDISDKLCDNCRNKIIDMMTQKEDI